MRRRGTQILVLVGICWLCLAGIVSAQNGNQGNHGNQGNQGNHSNQGNPISAPEIDGGSAAGALMIAAGVLTVLREQLRSQ